MSNHSRVTSTPIEASAAEVWRVLNAEFTEVSNWGPGVITSGPNPATPDGLNGSAHGGRICQVEGLGETVEEVVDFDASAQRISYVVESDGLPPFLERLQNTWIVNAAGDDQCIVETHLDVTIDGSMSDSEASDMVDVMLGGAAGAASHLKSYIEPGN